MHGISLENLARDIDNIAGLELWFNLRMISLKFWKVLRQRKDMKIVLERDYITYKKPSGYRSYHVIVEYPVDTIGSIQLSWLKFKFGP